MQMQAPRKQSDAALLFGVVIFLAMVGALTALRQLF